MNNAYCLTKPSSVILFEIRQLTIAMVERQIFQYPSENLIEKSFSKSMSNRTQIVMVIVTEITESQTNMTH